MKNLKTYQNNGVIYKYSVISKGWEFNIPAINYTLICHFNGGVFIADKVANIILGSLKRTGQIDNLARHNIDLIIKKYSGKI